ncbi:MAG: flagellar hook protein, partial [Roseateles sp.]
MASLSSVGISGSGLDESLITKLVAVQKQPITDLNNRTDAIKTRLSTYGQIQSALSTLRDAAAKLTNPATWAGSKTTTSDATVATATAASSAVGNVTLAVSQLASAQTLAGPTLSGPSATLGQGTLTLELGSWGTDGGGATTFTSKSGTSPVSVNITATDTLATIRDKINGAGAGVTAAIVTDATGSRLTLSSSQTGETNAFRVTVADGDGNSGDASGLSQLAYDPSSSA